MDAEADLFIDWRKDLVDVAHGDGDKLDQLYLAMPEGKLSRDMAIDEIKEHYREVRKAKIKEINRLYDLGCVKRWLRRKIHDIKGARCVVIWMVTDGNVGVKCRFAVRGFKDELQDLDAYAGTINRSGHRLVNAVASENRDFILCLLDVSQAFAK